MLLGKTPEDDRPSFRGRRIEYASQTLSNSFQGTDMPSDSPGDLGNASDQRLESTLGLLERARQGDTSAMDLLCRRYLPRLKRWASGRLPREARGLLETDDVVQDVLVKTVRRVEAFEPREGSSYLGFHAYLRTALLNRIRDAARSARRLPEVVDLDDQFPHDAGMLPIESAISREASDQYEAALARLKPQEREAVIMRLELGLSYEDIGDVLGKPTVNAARMTVVRALERLIRDMSVLDEPHS